ncbi:hexameric tyrosine-coordinated heme protein (HTHP) [Alkalibaculum bacchi]|uniref:Hexameric tyrosine-coordinated heme protein (HTHP) n=1 Tax=Alkalibaculum bacchi TaxID=645887 RepID=A0A366I2T7_9FIRM|nr:hexameric tyrosine-coordinated heme protein [Alkalibaculum bacchi]RBP61069.1 hexameric tyrosine-coordinated heme protein (HTHP) [Alkalibaculum bacchi]
MAEWLATLRTDTPEEGYNLAVTLARKAISMTQPYEVIRKILRP